MSNKPKIDLDSAPKLERLPDSAYDDIEVEDNRFTANLFGTPEPDDNDYNHIVWDDLAPPEDEKVVTKIAAKERPASRPKRHEAIKEVEMLDQFIGLPDSVANTVIGRYAIGIATMLEFPEVSAFMTLMGCASASVSCNYAVQYRFGSSLSTGLYVVVEQPPSTQKSRLLGLGLNTYMKAMAKHNKVVFGKLREAKEGDPELYSWLKPGFVAATDATSASIDKHLANCSEGRFVIASAEQSALTSLFPSGNSYSSTNELILKGYAGEHVSGMRSGRNAFSGIANGSITLIAQNGSSSRILKESNGTGMAERFFFVAEPDYLGSRTFDDIPANQEDKKAFETASMACVQAYSKRVLDYSNAREEKRVVLDPDNMIQLRATEEGYDLIRRHRVGMEGRMQALKNSGDMVMLSWLGKFEAHTLKVAAILHVYECLGNLSRVPEIIPTKMLMAAMDVVEAMSEHQEQLIRDSGESGSDAEEQAVIEALTGSRIPMRALLQKLRFRKPFRSMGKRAYTASKRRVDIMLASGALIVSASGNLEIV